MSRYIKHPVDQDGWTDWFIPAPQKNKPFKFACCECNLVHQMELRFKDGDIQIRAKRDVRATAAKRRAK
jgi:hypothetical protein